MTKLEKQQRSECQQQRKKQITKRSIILLVLVAAFLISGIFAKHLSQNTFITYTESGKADYQVYLNSNEFYSEDYLDENHAYVSALINEITANFCYDMNVDSSKANFDYSYYVDARLEILDNDSGAPLFDPTYELLAKNTGVGTGNNLAISESVVIDYREYNMKAAEFVSEYDLAGTNSTLIVTLHVNVLSNCPDYADSEQGNYDVEMRIPLNKETLKISTSVTVPDAESKILACNNQGAILCAILSGVLGLATVAWGCMLVCYILRTRDPYSDYIRRVRKILSSYQSYIQKINNPFDAAGYQKLDIATFPELLEIRDTLQMPILMYEDEEKTYSEFIIAGCNNLLYCYKISVEAE